MRVFGFILLLLGLIGAVVNLWWFIWPVGCETTWSCAWAAPTIEKAQIPWLIGVAALVWVGKNLFEPE